MKTKKKKIIFLTILSLLILLVIFAVYYLQFTNCYRMTVPYRYSFEKLADNIYVNKSYSGDKEEIVKLVDSAKERDKAFFGELQCLNDTLIIICDDSKLLSKLGGEKDTVTFLFPSKKNYTSISNEYLNLDILSHEITHAELHSRLTANALKKIPTWFDEGIATQNDYREQYGLEAWIEQTNNGKNTIALEDMDTPSEFYAGTAEDRRFRYLNAKHEVSKWIETNHIQGLLELLDRLNHGEDFNTAYDG